MKMNLDLIKKMERYEQHILNALNLLEGAVEEVRTRNRLPDGTWMVELKRTKSEELELWKEIAGHFHRNGIGFLLDQNTRYYDLKDYILHFPAIHGSRHDLYVLAYVGMLFCDVKAVRDDLERIKDEARTLHSVLLHRLVLGKEREDLLPAVERFKVLYEGLKDPSAGNLTAIRDTFGEGIGDAVRDRRILTPKLRHPDAVKRTMTADVVREKVAKGTKPPRHHAGLYSSFRKE